MTHIKLTRRDQRAFKLAREHGITIEPHGPIWRAYGQGIEILMDRPGRFDESDLVQRTTRYWQRHDTA